MNMLEKRRYQRLAVKLPVTIRYRGRLIPATMLNLSCGGACIQTSKGEIDLDCETPVEIIFDLDPKQRDVSMRGSVVHQGEDAEKPECKKAGVRFSNLFSDGHKAIQEYLRKNLN